jgi:hypothetical protein
LPTIQARQESDVLARGKSGASDNSCNFVLVSPGGDYTLRHAAAAETLMAGTSDGIYILQRTENGEWALVHRALQGCFVSALTARSD